MNKNLLSFYGLKHNPFSPDVPTEALQVSPKLENFCWRIENTLVREGGFALMTGDPGMGKSVSLRILARRLEGLRDVTVKVLEHPQSNLGDFYRELGDLFGVPLRPNNRWGAFKTLRERWKAHIESTLIRPILLVDEAQEMNPVVFNELRLLCSTQFDSRSLLSVVLAGDNRLIDKLRLQEMIPLGSRLRIRLTFETATREELMACLDHQVQTSGNPNLMTKPLMETLCEHALGNYRVLTTMAGELLALAAQREYPQIDEKLYFELFAANRTGVKNAGRTR